ncbi:MAG: hypothetical protein CVU65_13965 [Deltaproteobacteria bacterium HGW-Deltaproteobacteria-22]|jgi:hypothetical protein|nr:MAG: hypothetical protein CVU65_13965 [Deltaproteobacteria bacterium HGW-Deltaproteobacteria-22]
MKRHVLLAVFALVQLSACQWLRGIEGSGVIVEEKREVKGFTEVRISGGYEVKITAGQEESLVLVGDDNLLPLITTVVEDGVLIVKNKKAISPKSPIRLTLSAKALTRVKVSGSARGTVSGIDAAEFSLECSGSCKLALTGKAVLLNVGVSGSGEVDATALPANKADVRISGSGKIDVTISESLKVNISGSGAVSYAGDAARIEQTISGSGKVARR